MHIYQIIIEYDGTNFSGWQIQKKENSVQETIEKILTKILKVKIKLYGSGRTDSGVHAVGQSAHFASKLIINNTFVFLNSINFFLKKESIAILSLRKRKNNFHSRYSATKRKYKYIIINRIAPLSLDSNRAWHIKNKLNIDLMKRGAKLLLGTKDFSTFRSSSCNAKTPIKTLQEVDIKKKNNSIEIIFTSKSFLQQQVRSMVGCLKFVGEEKWSLKQFKDIINSKKRIKCAPPAPPCGLYLMKVLY